MKCGCVYKLTVNNCLLNVHSNITIGHLTSIISNHHQKKTYKKAIISIFTEGSCSIEDLDKFTHYYSLSL